MPYDHFDKDKLSSFEKQNADFIQGRPHAFFASGTAAIRYLLHHLDLHRNDEVFIATTSGSPFLSTCVSGAIQNFCRLSRVLTKKTKLVFVVHEFGIAFPEIESLVAEAGKRGIPVLEDAAHSITSMHNNQPLGTHGNYLLHSLPKMMPVVNGGLLIGVSPDEKHPDTETALQARNNFKKYQPYLYSFQAKRRNHYAFWKERLKQFPEIYDAREATAFVYAFRHAKWEQIYQRLDVPNGTIQMGRSYNPGWVMLPTNEWMETADMEVAFEDLQKSMNKA